MQMTQRHVSKVAVAAAALLVAGWVTACGGSGGSGTSSTDDDVGTDTGADATEDSGVDVADVSDDGASDTATDITDTTDAADTDIDVDAEADADVPIACVSTNGCQSVAPGSLCIDGTCQPCADDSACRGDEAFGADSVCTDGACVVCSAGSPGCPCDDGACASGACVAEVCVDCSPGDEGCACTDEGACDVGFRCTDELLCEACPPGEPGCPCDEGLCTDGYACIGDLCVTDDCVAGAVGCPCDEGLCDDDLFCDDDSLCMVCDADGVGCPCTIEEGCANDLICDVESDEDDAPLVCRTEYTCDDDRCLDNQLCADEDEPDGDDAECLEACDDGWEWDAESATCIVYVGPNCTPGERRSEYETCLSENRECVEEGETASCGDCLDFFVDDEGGGCRAVLTCADLVETCALELRDCEDETATTDAFCGECSAGAILEDGDCVIPANTCADGAYSIAATCASASRECLPNLDEGGTLESAECGDCLEGFAETDEGDCAVASYCEDLGCDLLGRSCAGDPFASCGDCEGALVPSDDTDPASLCRDALTCDDIDCGDDYCFVSEAGGDAFCASPCEDGFALDDYGSCVECAITCSDATDGATGRTWPLTRDGSDSCVCETEDGWFLDPSRAALPQPCDRDGDGWVRESAATYINSDDAVIAENARCTLQTIGSFTLRNEWQQDYELRICGTELVPVDEVDASCEDPTTIDLYEADELDDDDAIEALTGFFPRYANAGSGRVLYASELNPLTKACVSEIGDHNANEISDVEEYHTMDAPDGVTFDEADLIWVQMAYFVEVHDGSFEARPLEETNTWVIAERSRCESAASDRPFAIGYDESGDTDYWRECSRTRASDVDLDGAATGYDFQQYSCDADSGSCDLPTIPVNAAERDEALLVDHGLCNGADLPPEDGIWRGMNHASQFVCVVLSDAPSESFELAVDEVFDGTDGAWAFNTCGVACEDAAGTCADDCADGVCSSTVESDGSPSLPVLECDVDLAPEAGDVGFVAARYIDSEDGVTYAYERGCIDEWKVWPDLCPGYIDPAELPDGSDEVTIGDGLAAHFGEILCGCGTNYGGEACEIGCPGATVSADYDVASGWWMCADFGSTFYADDAMDPDYGPASQLTDRDGDVWVVTPRMDTDALDGAVLCETAECDSGFVLR